MRVILSEKNSCKPCLTSHITNNACERLGINGAETPLRLSTLALDKEIIECKRVTGLQLRWHKSLKRLRIPSFPLAYTQDKIPGNPDQIPSRETALGWKHLQPIADEMLPRGSCKVGILIGHKCHLAFKPRKLLYAKDDEDPFAVKADFGWSVLYFYASM